jgi:hypothetical protein
MGNVVQLKTVATDASDQSIVRGYLDAYLLALAESQPAIGAAEAQIENDIRIIDSIMRSTKSAHLHEVTLLQLNNIRSQLYSITIKLSDAKSDLMCIADIVGSRAREQTS